MYSEHLLPRQLLFALRHALRSRQAGKSTPNMLVSCRKQGTGGERGTSSDGVRGVDRYRVGEGLLLDGIITGLQKIPKPDGITCWREWLAIVIRRPKL